MKLFRKIFPVFLVFLLIFALFPINTLAGEAAPQINISSAALDGKLSTKVKITDAITISSKNPVDYIYIVFWDEYVPYTVSSGGETVASEGEFLHSLTKLDFCLGEDITITFSGSTVISDIYAFSGELPDFVQNWQSNQKEADLLLFSTHADDEQLFFAGVLPLYATDGETEVQVAYFTDHNQTITRRHELLNGLWAVGVKRYPVISPFPDAYSESYEQALANLEKAGFSETAALGWQVEQIRRFKPLVILGHDLAGEYGHGQHILNSNLLTQAVIQAADSQKFTPSAEQLGVWNTPKLYLHLYNENEVVLNLDTPIDSLGGKTPFEISKEGFACHNTQQGTWFKTWLCGKNGEIKTAAQIKTYSPCKFGLYRTTVGNDVLKTDLFENVIKRSLIPAPEEPQAPTIEIEQSNKTISPWIFGISAAFAAMAIIIIFMICKTKKSKH